LGISEQLFVTRVTSGQAFGGQGGAGQRLDQQHLNHLGQQSRIMKVYESFTLQYKVQWPLSLVISNKAINKYQLIFRHLLFQKYVETSLEKAWSIHQSTKECNIQAMFAQTYRTRHKMLQFCKNYLYYMLFEVLEPNFNKFKENLKQVKTIDEIIVLHNNFLDQCLNECLLTNQRIHGIINHINLRSHFFSRVIVRFFSSSSR
jgi:gamma-tubulin complex component 2